jgi:hypothetical protein
VRHARSSAVLGACRTRFDETSRRCELGRAPIESGERMRDGVSYEIYRNTPENSPKEKLETELYIPLD